MLGRQLERRGNLAAAVESWQLGVQKDPGHAEMLASLARAMAQLDRFSGATFVVQQLLGQPGWKARANLLLGDIYDLMNAPEQAALALGRGLDEADPRIEPAEVDRSRRLLARCLLRTGKPAQARAARALLSHPSENPDPELGFLLARCDLQEGKSLSTPSAAKPNALASPLRQSRLRTWARPGAPGAISEIFVRRSAAGTGARSFAAGRSPNCRSCPKRRSPTPLRPA